MKAELGLASLLLLLVWAPLVQASPIKIWDTHLHYNAMDAQIFKPQTIVQKLEINQIEKAMVTSNPPMLVQQLKKASPDRILPLLGVYQGKTHKNNWLSDSKVPQRLKQHLQKAQWIGIGEIHLFAEQRHNPIFKEVVLIARQHQLPLLIHSDPAVIDRTFLINPDAKVIWAHAGKYPYIPLLKDYLNRYPNLMIDLSVREDLIAPDGELDEAWEMLLEEHSSRFTLGVDTYSINRWHQFGKVTQQLRQFINQLSEEAQNNIFKKNAQKFFTTS